MAGQNPNLTIAQIKNMIGQLLQEIMDACLTDMDAWIDKFVPKRTGQLRDNLHRNIRSSRVRSNVMRIIIRTSIDYAEKVNQMSDAMVQHDNTWKEHSGRWAYAYYWGHYGKILLNDPDAIGKFFDTFVEFTKDRVLVNMIKIKNKYMGKKLPGKKVDLLEYNPGKSAGET